MSDNRYKVIEGKELRPENIQMSRAAAIYRVAKSHPFVSDVSCRLTSQGDVVILMTVDCEIPDLVKYDIREKEQIAIKCNNKDNRLPEVFALRNDFPLGLPHSNAVPYDHPVSLCVSDVLFQDLRTNFSAFIFIEQVRIWFAKNSIGELHEKDRPLEVFYNTEEFSYFPIKPDPSRFYRHVKYNKLSKLTSIIEETSESESNYCMVIVPVSANVSGYVRRIPKKLGDLRGLKTFDGQPFIDTVLNYFYKSPFLRKCEKPIMVAIVMPLKREEEQEYEDLNLFALRIEKPVRSIFWNLSQQTRIEADNYIDGLVVNMSFILNGMSITRLGDFNGQEHMLNEVTLLGTGALGSQILDHFVRRGQAKTLHLVDEDKMAPHNVARHTLDICDAMKSKVEALRLKYRGIDGLKIYAYQEDFLNCKEQTLERVMSNSELVIDASTSVGVERHLALDMNQYTARRCTAFLNPKGTDLVLLVEDSQRNHRLDYLEMEYYRNIIVDANLTDHLSTPEMQRTNIFSCRAESVVMDYDNIGVLASIVSAQIPLAQQSDKAKLAIWHLDAGQGEVQCFELPYSKWLSYKDGKVTIHVCQAVLEEMTKQRDAKLLIENPVETGGTFIGTYDKDRNIIYVVYMIPAPDDSVEAGTSYIRGVNGLYETVEEIKLRTGHQMVYLGEWHSHPHGCSNSPSPTDEHLFDTMSTEMSSSDFPFVMGILGDAGLYLKVQM